MELQQLDRYVTHAEQLTADTPGPVVLVNIFHVAPDRVDELTAKWAAVLQRFKSLEGFISAQFHRGTAGSGTVMNYAVFETVAHYRRAFENPEFREMLAGYPEGTVATPHLFQKVAVPNVCVA